MGAIARLFGAEKPSQPAPPPMPSNTLGLGGTGAMPLALRQEAEYQKQRRMARGEVISTEISVIGVVSQVAQRTVSNIQRSGEIAAQYVPEERAGIDSVTDVATTLVNQSFAKLAEA